MKRTREQVGVKDEARTPGRGVALVKEPEELSLCLEHSRDAKEYSMSEYFEEGELEEKRLDRQFRGRAHSLNRVRTKLKEARAGVEHLQD